MSILYEFIIPFICPKHTFSDISENSLVQEYQHHLPSNEPTSKLLTNFSTLLPKATWLFQLPWSSREALLKSVHPPGINCVATCDMNSIAPLCLFSPSI